DALGLSGVDGGLLTAQPLQNGTALGEVGEIVNVRASLLHSLLLAGLTPVVAPVAPSVTAPVRPLNVNADQAAAAIAAAAWSALTLRGRSGAVTDGATGATTGVSPASNRLCKR